ncbi:MAG: metalloregulator ArsR/SmtB family transcription factor [Oscillospiraceae bacterium]
MSKIIEDREERLSSLAENFRDCQDVLFAIGDKTRQSIIIALIDAGCTPGIRVGEITQKTHLSRPAVSHHLKVLKDAKILNVISQGTMNYYSLDPQNNDLIKLKTLVSNVEEILHEAR